VFAHFLGPAVLHLRITRKVHDTLFYIGMAFVVYGIFLTVVPAAWTPFSARFTLPKVGWAGVFAVAIFFDLAASALAFFVLRKMKLPEHLPEMSYAPHPPDLMPAHGK
jgi:hypothetical protein